MKCKNINNIEKYVIQYLFLYQDWFHIMKTILSEDSFNDFKYKTIFSTMRKIDSSDITLVAYELQKKSLLKTFGGLIGLVNMISEMKNVSRFNSYVNFLVKNK